MSVDTAAHGELARRLRLNPAKVVLRIVSPSSDSGCFEFTGQDILEKSKRLVGQLTDIGVEGVVLILLPHCPELFLLQLGLTMDGFCPAILPWPTNRVDPEKYHRNLVHHLQQLPALQLITVPQLAEKLKPLLPYRVTACDVTGAPGWAKLFERGLNVDAPPAQENIQQAPSIHTDAVFLQFSGGTTGTQKCVAVSETMLREQLGRLADSLKLGEGDGVVSWLPMYHDMGLIACLWFPLWFGIPSTQIAASDWLMNPEILFHYIQDHRGTLCWLPNFAFSYLAQRRESMAKPYALSHVRAWINCSEPVRLRSTLDFVETFSDWGVTRESVQASYAMAESTFAVTQSELGRELSTVSRGKIIAADSSSERPAFALEDEVYVSSGKPLRDTQVRVVDPSGVNCTAGKAGEIQIQTPSLFAGYWGRDGFRTTSFTLDGWYATGDYGLLLDGELYVIGRIKDIVIVAGQNIFPEDVEYLVNAVDGVYPGRVAAFGIDNEEYGTQGLAIVAEMKSGGGAVETIEREIRRVVLTGIGVAPRYVAVMPQRWIVKSTAGKISRRETRDRFIRENLSNLGNLKHGT